LNWLIGSNRGKRYFLKSAKQTTGIASINMTQLRGFPMVMPPLDLQASFERRVGSIERAKAGHRQSLAQLDALFVSLQHRAFLGQV
jgi:type I restriction enzyme S subunit